MLECISLKLKVKAKECYTNLSAQAKPRKTWEQFVTLFEEFRDEDLQTTLAKCYKLSQKRSKTLKAYFNRFQKHFKQHDTIVKREVAIRYSQNLTVKNLKPLISDPAMAKREKEEFYNEETTKLCMSKENRVDALTSGLRHCRSHFLITKCSTMEEVRQIVLHITRKRQWNTTSKKRYSDSDSDSDNNSDLQVIMTLIVHLMNPQKEMTLSK